MRRRNKCDEIQTGQHSPLALLIGEVHLEILLRRGELEPHVAQLLVTVGARDRASNRKVLLHIQVLNAERNHVRGKVRVDRAGAERDGPRAPHDVVASRVEAACLPIGVRKVVALF